ncbi:hypothetical protein GJA_3281 [Janthinobacterium agaricidamnosum NBRC 102515 = DSM 9628]|uniref:Uncharacterized protein n=1 Tax=Janthinobacterium agaricidamnosum NBRC 102515 = DSM 9628 TaxID=1349767 RepID=W0V7P9_9BURK|nr:hypothetical protein GJA_3281 [Janthinobacterium agaricidamnosum NBRC 102515 = DSM 9628]
MQTRASTRGSAVVEAGEIGAAPEYLVQRGLQVRSCHFDIEKQAIGAPLQALRQGNTTSWYSSDCGMRHDTLS